MQDYFREDLAKLQSLNLEGAKCKFWLIKRKLHKGISTYSALLVDIDDLYKDFINLITLFIKNIEEVLEYAPLSEDLDGESVLLTELNETDFEKIIAEIDKGSNNNVVKDLCDFEETWGYSINVSINDKQIFTFNKIHDGWNIKKKLSVMNLVFSDGKFEQISSKPYFPICKTLDFICFGQTLFIKNKTNFELGLNIRERLLQKRDVTIKSLAESGCISNSDEIIKLIGNNKHHLRKLAMVEHSKYFTQKEYLDSMEKLIKERNYSIERCDGKFVLTDQNISLFLSLLNNSHLKSMINTEMFEADIKKKLS